MSRWTDLCSFSTLLPDLSGVSLSFLLPLAVLLCFFFLIIQWFSLLISSAALFENHSLFKYIHQIKTLLQLKTLVQSYLGLNLLFLWWFLQFLNLFTNPYFELFPLFFTIALTITGPILSESNWKAMKLPFKIY